MLRIDSIKLPPEAGMAELAAEAARLLRMREKDILSLRLLRRSVDAREEVRLVYTVEVAVKEESAILRRARSRKISRPHRPRAYTPPSPPAAPAVPPVVVAPGPRALRRPGAGPGGAAPHPAGAGAARWSGGRRMWNGSGPRESWT